MLEFKYSSEADKFNWSDAIWIIWSDYSICFSDGMLPAIDSHLDPSYYDVISKHPNAAYNDSGTSSSSSYPIIYWATA